IAVDDRHIEIELKPGVTIRGRLLADDKPIEQAGLEVVAVARNRRGFVAREKTDDQGRYELTGLDENECAVLTAAFNASGKELVATPRVIEKQIPGANVSADLICTSGHVVAGRVTDGENQATADHYVHGSFAGFEQSFAAKTDVEGRYRLRLAPGDYRLLTEDWHALSKQNRSGYVFKRISREVSIATAVPPGEVNFQLEMVEIQSRLVDEQGVGVSGICYWNMRSYSQGGWPYPTNEDGMFWPPPVPYGPRYQIYGAVSRDKSLCRLFVWSGDKQDFPEEIVLAPMAKVIGRLADVDVEGFDAETFMVRAERMDGRFPSRVELPRDLWRLTLQADGAFELSVPTGLGLSLGFRTEPGQPDGAALFSVDDLKPGETRDVGNLHP
ncbi:MAG TPA: carboxypeptidase-like regulatory domain-containing protein, partial [Pirellulales bacterium]|nr:carboxypeptidase-like regulatory domain-containing protein [Pirellulales bacterium]